MLCGGYAFLNVNVGNFTLDWPMKVQVDPAVRPPTQFRAIAGLVSGAGWNAFTTGMSVKFVPPARYTFKLASTAIPPPITTPPDGVLPPTNVEYSRLLGPLNVAFNLLKKNWLDARAVA